MEKMNQKVQVGTRWKFECFRFYHEDGSRCTHPWNCERGHRRELAWEDGFRNLVVTVGLNKLLDATFKTGLAAPAWYVGLKDTGAPDPADTMASHASWAEISPYSNVTRPAFTPGAIADGAVDNSASKASFTIDAPDTIYGGFLCDDDEVDGVGGTLYGAGDFATERAVIAGDVLNVEVDLEITAA